MALSYRTNVRYLLNLIMRFLPFGRNDTTMALGGNIYIITIFNVSNFLNSPTCRLLLWSRS